MEISVVVDDCAMEDGTSISPECWSRMSGFIRRRFIHWADTLWMGTRLRFCGARQADSSVTTSPCTNLELTRDLFHRHVSQCGKAMQKAANRKVLILHDALKQVMLASNLRGLFGYSWSDVSLSFAHPELRPHERGGPDLHHGGQSAARPMAEYRPLRRGVPRITAEGMTHRS